MPMYLVMRFHKWSDFTLSLAGIPISHSVDGSKGCMLVYTDKHEAEANNPGYPVLEVQEVPRDNPVEVTDTTDKLKKVKPSRKRKSRAGR